MLTHEWYMHPNGQLPAYEWAFGDVNPPVHAWAAWRVYQMDAALTGKPRLEFLERVFHKLMMNFTGGSTARTPRAATCSRAASSGWTISACSTAAAAAGRPGMIDQSDGTAWMAMYALNLMRISLELATATVSMKTSRRSSSSISCLSPRR